MAVASLGYTVAPARAVLAAIDSHALDPPRVGIEHLDLEPGGTGHQFAADRHAPDLQDQIAAGGIDLFGHLADVELGPDYVADIFEARSGLGHNRAGRLETAG